MTEIPVSDNFEPAPGVKYDDTPAVQPEVPSTVTEPEKTEEPAKPAAEPQAESKVEPEAPKAEEQPAPAKVERKAKPIATLLEKKHQLEVSLSEKEQEIARLKADMEKFTQQPASQQTPADLKALAEKHGVDETFLAELAAVVNKSVPTPGLPREVQELIAENARRKEQEAEQQAFDANYARIAATFKDEPLASQEVKDKILALAYSTELAPDGIPYYQKELSEIYFAYVKPTVEPGKPSAEPSRKAGDSGEVLDFEEIYNRDNPKDIEAMDSETFSKFNAWVKSNKEGKTPIRRA